MTGFARAVGQDGRCTWAWEAKSVNGRGLDLRCRVPPGFDVLEAEARQAVGRRMQRGNIQLSLTVQWGAGQTRYRINRDLLADLLRVTRELGGAVGAPTPRLEGLLTVRGVVEIEDEAESEPLIASRLKALQRALDEVLDGLVAARLAEGQRLKDVLAAQLGEMDRLAGAAGAMAPSQPAAIKERLRLQVAELLAAAPALSEERLAQEAALLAARADIREELDRLAAHIAQALELIDGGGAVGRRLDFLCQELNREANTLCSKANDLELTRIGMAFKVVVEQFREQVQNIE
ncbi:MAG: YicC family protein [Alphaproteobacteria bacterium]|nr:YicC family protein [Alphaproteobacteria bacterium]